MDNKFPFGMTESQWNKTCDSMKSPDGSYTEIFKLQEGLSRLQKDGEKKRKEMEESKMEETRMSCIKNVGIGDSIKLAAIKEIPRKEWTQERYDNLQTEMKQFNGNTIWETIK